jgi:hypothetical protein
MLMFLEHSLVPNQEHALSMLCASDTPHFSLGKGEKCFASNVNLNNWVYYQELPISLSDLRALGGGIGVVVDPPHSVPYICAEGETLRQALEALVMFLSIKRDRLERAERMSMFFLNYMCFPFDMSCNAQRTVPPRRRPS